MKNPAGIAPKNCMKFSRTGKITNAPKCMIQLPKENFLVKKQRVVFHSRPQFTDVGKGYSEDLSETEEMLLLFIYLGFYVAFNTVQVISR